MSVSQEFSTVDAILATHAETRGVDAFALCVIKAERQLRKLFTHLVFQSSAFGASDVPGLSRALGENKSIYYRGFVAGIELVSPEPVSVLVGSGHDALRARLDEAIEIRNKIFHGQLTDRELTRDDLLDLVRDLRGWCVSLAAGGMREVAYDGFGRNSFQKRSIPNPRGLRLQFRTVDEYRHFLRTVVGPASRKS